MFYTFLVIFSKACLQIVICLLSEKLDATNLAILIDLFGVDCRTLPTGSDPTVHNENVDLVWDVFCFIVLILQRRMYMSHMFQFVVYEYKAQSQLAAMGSCVFKFIIQRRVMREKAKEDKEFNRIKNRVRRIKGARVKQSQAKDYYTSIRSGDRYMFEPEYDCFGTSESERDTGSQSDYDQRYIEGKYFDFDWRLRLIFA